MPPETPEHVTLREYFERLLAEHDKAVALQFSNAQTALNKAESALSDRLQGMNEFRDQLRDQAAKFVTQSELAAKVDAIDNRIKALENQRANLEGRFWAIGAAIVVVNLAIALAGLLINKP